MRTAPRTTASPGPLHPPPKCRLPTPALRRRDEAGKVVVMYAERGTIEPAVGTAGTGVMGVVATKVRALLPT